ncbi:MAG TPA: hypothetical protein H9743_05165 [Candidatus Mediterraneibacter vanvlietii]|nr:hypothetical protein [Candidatus Mediterraneibacter vanvlietii]
MSSRTESVKITREKLIDSFWDLFEDLKGKLSAVLKSKEPETIDTFSELCVESFMKDNKKINLLLRSDPDFGKKFKSELVPVLNAAGILPEDFPHKDFVFSSIFYSMLNTISYWYGHADEITPKDLLRMNDIMLLKGISGLTDGQGV